jgi:hypothetical protein
MARRAGAFAIGVRYLDDIELVAHHEEAAR